MKITLISLDQMIISSGIRSLSSCLKQEGYAVETVFLRAATGQPLVTDVLNSVVKLCQNSKLIGISLMSNQFPQAVALTQALKNKSTAPVLWGGIHPTFCPEESLRYADLVCVGEAEISLPRYLSKLTNKQYQINIPGIWYRNSDGQIKNNGAGILVNNLDKLPLADFGPENHYIRDEGTVKKMTKKLFKKYLTKRETLQGTYVAEYYISTSRGCPYKCAYCASNTIKNLYTGMQFFRLRSPQKVIEEVKLLAKKYPFIKWIYFADDDLFASSFERVGKFCSLWKQEINLPFYATTAPWSYDEEKAILFKNAGLEIINMGIQTISTRGCATYHRFATKKQLQSVINSIHQLKLKLPPVYDFILDNPYEKDRDRLENLNFILKMPRPFKLQLFSLIPFPGTELYNTMKKDNLLINENQMIFQKSYSYPEASYINMLTFLANTNFPRGLISLLRSRIFLTIFNNNLAKYVYKLIPYQLFIITARRLFTSKFWKFNTIAKGDQYVKANRTY